MLKAKKNKIIVVLSSILLSCLTIVSLLFAFPVKVGVADTEPSEFTYYLKGKQNYQGENNRYFLAGDYAESELSRMYPQLAQSTTEATIVDNETRPATNVWVGVSHDTNWIQSDDDSLTLSPYPGSDVVVAQVLEWGGTLNVVGTLLNSIEENATGDVIRVSIHLKKYDNATGAYADTQLASYEFEQGGVTDVSISVEKQTVLAGDVVYFVAQVASKDATEWSGIILQDVTVSVTGCTRRAGTATVAYLGDKLAYTENHVGTLNEENELTGGWFNVYYMHIMNNGIGNVQAVYKYPKMGEAKDKIAPFTAHEMEVNDANVVVYDIAQYEASYKGTGTGILDMRVFYNNPTWCGTAGYLFTAPTDGTLNVLGLATLAKKNNTQPLGLEIYKIPKEIMDEETGLDVSSVAPTILTGEVIDFNKTEETSNVRLSAGEGYLITFRCDAPEQIGSMSMAFDFYTEPKVYAEQYTVSFDSNGGEAVAPQTVDVNEAATAPTAPTRDGYTFAGWTLDGSNVYDFNTPITDSMGNTHLVAQWQVNGSARSMNVAATGAIKALFKYELPAVIQNSQTAYVSLSINGREEQVLVKDAKDENGNYWFGIELAAKEMTMPITVRLSDGAGVWGVNTYTDKNVEAYLANVIGNLQTEEQGAFIKAMMNYGAYAQIAFNGETESDKLLNKYLSEEDKKVVDGFDFSTYFNDKKKWERTCEENNALVSAYGLEMFLDTEATLRLYITTVYDIKDYTFTLTYQAGNVTKSFDLVAEKSSDETKPNEYYVDIPNIAAPLFDREYTVTVSRTVVVENGETSESVTTNESLTFNAIVYLEKLVAGGDGITPEVQNLAKAICIYADAADKYFNI